MPNRQPLLHARIPEWLGIVDTLCARIDEARIREGYSEGISRSCMFDLSTQIQKLKDYIDQNSMSLETAMQLLGLTEDEYNYLIKADLNSGDSK